MIVRTADDMREAAARTCDRIAGNTADFTREYRRAAGHCAFLIRQIEIERDPFQAWEIIDDA
jgi:hypothetical protein